MSNYLLDLKKKAKKKTGVGSKSARDKLIKLYKKKSKGTNVLKKVASKSAYSKLKSTSTLAGAIKKLKTIGGGAARTTKGKAKAPGKGYTVKEYQAYLNKVKAGHKKYGIKTRRKKGYSI